MTGIMERCLLELQSFSSYPGHLWRYRGRELHIRSSICLLQQPPFFLKSSPCEVGNEPFLREKQNFVSFLINPHCVKLFHEVVDSINRGISSPIVLERAEVDLDFGMAPLVQKYALVNPSQHKVVRASFAPGPPSPVTRYEPKARDFHRTRLVSLSYCCP